MPKAIMLRMLKPERFIKKQKTIQQFSLCIKWGYSHTLSYNFE